MEIDEDEENNYIETHHLNMDMEEINLKIRCRCISLRKTNTKNIVQRAAVLIVLNAK